MAWYEWVFSGIGVLILGWIIPPIVKWWQRRHDNKENQKLIRKQIKVLDRVLEQQRIQDLPDIRYDNAILFNTIDGFLQIKIINVGKSATVTDVSPQYGNWQYVGPGVPFFMPNNATVVLQIRIPVIGNTVQIPDCYKIYLKVVDRHSREYSIAIEATPNSISTTDLIPI